MWKVCDDELISDTMRKVITKAISIQTITEDINANNMSGIILVTIVRPANASRYDSLLI